MQYARILAVSVALICEVAHAQLLSPIAENKTVPQFGESLISDRPAFAENEAEAAVPSVFGNRAPVVSIDAAPTDPLSNAAQSVCDCDQSLACGNDCWPRWDYQFSSIVFWRDNTAQNSALIRPNTVDFDGGGGPKLLGRMIVNPYQAFEAQWYTFANDGGRMFYNWSNFYVTDYYSSLSNGEISYVHSWNRFSILGGFRALRWSENYEELYTPGGNQLQMHTDNDLYGGQIGARWKQQSQTLFWELTGKFGVFGNRANESQILRYSYGQSGSSASPRGYDFTTSVVYDINFSVGLRLSPVWSLRTGYNAIWIDQLALAPDQFSTFNNGRINTHGNVMLNGLEVGLEALW